MKPNVDLVQCSTVFAGLCQIACLVLGIARRRCVPTDFREERRMLDLVTTWFMAHPLTGVGGLAVLSVLIGLLLVPRVDQIVRHGHPRC